MDDATREFLGSSVPTGLATLERLLRANPGSRSLNGLWLQVWLRIGAPGDVKRAMRGVRSRVHDDTWVAIMEIHAHLSQGRRGAATRVGLSFRGVPEVDGVIAQLELLKGRISRAEGSNAVGREFDLLKAMRAARQGNLASETELVGQIEVHSLDDPFFADRAAAFLFGVGARKEAHSIVSALERAYPSYLEPKYIRARFSSFEGNPETARLLCSELLEHCPYHYHAARLAWRLNIRMGHVRDAVSPFLRMLKLVVYNSISDSRGP